MFKSMKVFKLHLFTQMSTVCFSIYLPTMKIHYLNFYQIDNKNFDMLTSISLITSEIGHHFTYLLPNLHIKGSTNYGYGNLETRF